MNKQILTAMEYLADNNSKSIDELECNRLQAEAAILPDIALQAASDVANYACVTAELLEAYPDKQYDTTEAAEEWLDIYFVLSGEKRQDYINAINGDVPAYYKSVNVTWNIGG